MRKRKSLEWFEMDEANYDFDFYRKKELVSYMLENQKPKIVEKFNSKGTEWDLWGDIDDYLFLNIEDVLIETNNCIGNFIGDFLQFLLILASTDNKALICPFDDEGSAYIMLTAPSDDKNIRVTVSHSGLIYKRYMNKKFLTDFVIKKDTFLKQMRDILQLAADVKKKERNQYYSWVKRIKYVISELDKYFENQEQYKKEFNLEQIKSKLNL